MCGVAEARTRIVSSSKFQVSREISRDGYGREEESALCAAVLPETVFA